MTDNHLPPFGDAGGSTPPPYGGAPPRPYQQAFGAAQPSYQAPPGYQAYGEPGFSGGQQSLGKATTAMVLGIVGLVSIPLCGVVLTLFLGPASFFVGRSASKQIDASPGQYSNAGQAKAGWIMGIIQIVVTVLGIMAIVALVAGGAFDS